MAPGACCARRAAVASAASRSLRAICTCTSVHRAVTSRRFERRRSIKIGRAQQIARRLAQRLSASESSARATRRRGSSGVCAQRLLERLLGGTWIIARERNMSTRDLRARSAVACSITLASACSASSRRPARSSASARSVQYIGSPPSGAAADPVSASAWSGWPKDGPCIGQTQRDRLGRGAERACSVEILPPPQDSRRAAKPTRRAAFGPLRCPAEPERHC